MKFAVGVFPLVHLRKCWRDGQNSRQAEKGLGQTKNIACRSRLGMIWHIGLLSFLYVSERIKKTADSSAFDRLITLGLTLHFLENSLTNATLPANTSLSATELLSALTQVKQAMADGKAHTDWFEDAGIAAPVGYYLAAQHFNYYPGGLMILDIFN